MSDENSVILQGLSKLRLVLGGLDGDGDAASRNPSVDAGAPNSQPLGALTGAPPRSRLFGVQVSNRQGGVLLVGPDRASRSVTITAPAVAFGVFLGVDQAPNIGDFPIVPLLPYELILNGYQKVWAITNSPVLVQVLVQVSPLLIGDRERALAL